jgi:hypothetical protein
VSFPAHTREVMRLYRQALTLTRNWTVDRRLFRMRKSGSVVE